LINCSYAVNNIHIEGNYTNGIINKTGIGNFYGFNRSAIGVSGGTCFVQGNNFSNIILTGASQFIGIRVAGDVTQTKFVLGNNVSNITCGTGNIYGIITHEEGPNSQFCFNTVSNISASENAQIAGCWLGGYASGPVYFNGNVINNINSSGAGIIYGVYHALSPDGVIYSSDNQIYGLSGNQPLSKVFGIYQSGSTSYIFNNFISDLKTPAGTDVNAITGLYIGSSVNMAGIYYNTIFLNATSSSTTTFGSSAIYLSVNPNVELRNNIIVNLSEPGPSGLTVAYRRSGTGLSGYLSESNNNDFYAGTPSANHLIYFDGTNADQTIEAFKARVAPRDNESISDNPHFMNSTTTPYDLHIDPSISTLIESGGKPVTTPVAITTDFDGDQRHASHPDIGADEFAGIFYTCTTPDPGNTNATASEICLGQEIVLSLQNATPGTGVLFQWQDSYNGVVFNNIPGANDEIYQVIPDASYYYRCRVTCLNGPSYATSIPIQIIVYNNIITSTTPGSRCGIGTVILEAAANPGAEIFWYDLPVVGMALGTGSPWETLVIDSTTTYYVAAETYIPVGGYVTVGSGTNYSSSSSYTPYCTGYEDGKHQFLFLADELENEGLIAGNITSLALDIVTLGSPAMTNFAVFLGQSASLSALTNTYETGLTTVYAVASYTPAGTGWQTLIFSTPFYWDGFSNLIVQICFGNNSSYSTGSSVRYSLTSFTSHHYGYMDNGSGCNMTTPTYNNVNPYRANMQFGGSVSVPCSSERIAVEATVIPPPPFAITGDQMFCNITSSLMSVISPLENYDIYTWSPVTGLFTDPGLTTPYVEDQNASVVYLKSGAVGSFIYTCTAVNSISACVNAASCVINLLETPSPVTVIPDQAYADGTIHQLIAEGGTLSNDYTLGTNSTTTSQTGVTPYSSYYEGVRKQYLLLAAELQALGMVAGNINSLSFQVTASGAGTYPQLNYTMKMAHTNNTEITGTYGTPSENWIIVYSNPSEPAPPVGWKTHEFITPFIWNGSSNVLIDICHENDNDGTCTNCYSSSSAVAYTLTAFNSVYARYNDNKPACDTMPTSALSSTYYKCRPNMLINTEFQAPITWSPLYGLCLDPDATIPYSGEVTNTIYANPVTPVTYYAMATHPNGCYSSGTCDFIPSSYGIILDIKVFLEGPHEGGIMHTNLNPLLPLMQPYNPPLPYHGNPAPFWLYNGTESVSEMPQNIVDWVLVELRDALSANLAGPQTVIGKKAALLNENGQIVGLNGEFFQMAAQASQGLFVVVYHRNHLPVMSSQPLSASSNVYSWDFTDGISKAYGNNLKLLGGGFTGMFGGDANGDGFTESGDLVFNWYGKAGETGYLAVDFNLDGQVDNQDKNDIWTPNDGVQCWVQSSTQNLMFYQVDFDFEGMYEANTEYGCLELSFIGQPDVLYLNLAVNGIWKLMNVPILSNKGINVLQTQSVIFDLGEPRGADVTSLNYAYSLTPAIASIPVTYTQAPVQATDFILWSGFQGGGGPVPLPFAGDMTGGGLLGSASHDLNYFPNQDCGINECAPAAVSNSLKFLNAQNNLGMTDGATSIDTMKIALGWSPMVGVTSNWFSLKNDFMQANNYPINTTGSFSLPNMDNLTDSIAAGCDVEFGVRYPGGGPGKGHIVAVTGISKLDNGKYAVQLTHDTKQGLPGGTKTETVIYDPVTNTFSGGTIHGCTLHHSVVESAQ